MCRWLMLVLLLALAALTAHAEPRHPSVPVLIEQYPYSGVVTGLDPRGDGFLAVKSGPGLNYDRIDKLYNKSRVYVVGRRGDWYAVVYLDEKTVDCNLPDSGTSFTTFRDMPYTGPCRSGWVHRRWVHVIAG
jgi:uncharacterized protein YgiM (DUF1202 family)